VGKLADLVILSADPTAVDPLQIEKIQVLETVKAGRSIYRRRDSARGGAGGSASVGVEKIGEGLVE
jgi:hypothetical protein